MSRYWNTGEYEQPSVALLQKNARQTARSAQKKGKVLEPVIIEGRAIAKSWWGQAWCSNLEKYADFDNRLDRGKRYVRNGSVVDLKIQKGKVSARVQGRRKAPYKVEIRISPLTEEHVQQALTKCGSRIANIEKLIKGDFPEELKELFTEKGGLFPEPREISFSCSCPDWALLCKHVAAVLYGIGARFDEDPLLFFTLRGINVERFIDVAVENRLERMLDNAQRPSDRIMSSENLEAIFGL